MSSAASVRPLPLPRPANGLVSVMSAVRQSAAAAPTPAAAPAPAHALFTHLISTSSTRRLPAVFKEKFFLCAPPPPPAQRQQPPWENVEHGKIVASLASLPACQSDVLFVIIKIYTAWLNTPCVCVIAACSCPNNYKCPSPAAED